MITKKEILEKCRNILYSSPIGRPICEEDYNYLINNIFPLHKDWESKRHGSDVLSVIVRRNPDYGNKQFAMILEDNSIVDISFIECVNREGLREEVREACRKVVEDIWKDDGKFESKVRSWIKNYDLGEISVGKYINHDTIEFTDRKIAQEFRGWYEGV